MPTSVVPALIDALVSQAGSALPSVTVYDSFGQAPGGGGTGNTRDFLMVGADDPDATDSALSASTQEAPGPYGTNRPRDELGEVVLVAQSWNGDGDQRAARSAVYAIAGAVADLCRATPNLGVSHLLWTGYGSSTEFRQNQTDEAAVARLTFRVSFRARI